MYYRIVVQRAKDQIDRPLTWQWKSTVLSSLQSLFQMFRLYGALPQECLRVFSSPSRDGLQEQLGQENSTGGSASVTAAHFLQQHLLHSRGVAEARGAQRCEETTSIAVSTSTWQDESARIAHVLSERSMASLEWRRLEYERGSGGDHDLPYRFALPLSLPQVLAWMTLLARVQRGELHS